MGKKEGNDALAGKAWRLLRLALAWTSKGRTFRRGLLLRMRTYLARIGSLHARSFDRIHYGERQFSFGETPDAYSLSKLRRLPELSGSLKLRLPRLPCVNATPADFDDRDGYCSGTASRDEERRGFLCWAEDEGGDAGEECCRGPTSEEEEETDEGVDARAEEFIARFHEQMRLQRQISLLQYNEMMLRSVC